MKRLCLLILFTLLYHHTLPAQNPVAVAFQKFTKDPALAHAGIGFVVMDAGSSEELYRYNAQQSLVPASTMKLLTTGAALGLLGENHRFKTRIAYSGRLQSDSTLTGDLLILSGGDPTLGSGRFKDYPAFPEVMNSWATAVKKAGIKRISGSIRVDTTYFNDAPVPGCWLRNDVGNYYGAGCWDLNLNENIYTLTLSSGNTGSPTKITATEPEIPELEIQNSVKADAATSGDNTCIFGGPGIYNCTITGKMPVNRSAFKVKGSIPDPVDFVAYAFRQALVQQGIALGTAPATTVADKQQFMRIDSTLSPPLSDIVYYTNLKSINLYAEALLKETGKRSSTAAAQESTGHSAQGILAVMQYWKSKGMDTDGLFMQDGSGLSPTDGVTARQLAQALTIARKEPWFNSLYHSMPVAGQSGAMSGMGKGSAIDGKLRAKTGHMERVRSYAGYYQTKSGRWLSFALIVNNYNASNLDIKNKIVRVLESFGQMP